ncbi:hypothetical protein BTVI_73965 [Pitangus sulphuratus]|nr:hypothetical protein BTVI_73965 [Pitangus sulphuratus]
MGSCRCGFLKGKSYLINLIAFYDEMSGLVDKGRAVYIDYLDLSKKWLIDQPYNSRKLYNLDKWTDRKITEFNERNFGVQHLKSNNPMHQYRLRKPGWKEALQEGTRDFSGQQDDHKSALCPYEEDYHIPVRLQQSDTSLGKMILPLCSALVGSIWGGMYSLGSEYKIHMDKLEQVQ